MERSRDRPAVKRRPNLRGAHLKGVISHLRKLERFAKLMKRKKPRKRKI